MKKLLISMIILLAATPVVLSRRTSDPLFRHDTIREKLQPNRYDTLMASAIPLLEMPENLRYRVLPPVVDNSQTSYFAGIHDQHFFYSCQQYTAATYLFGYEYNRLRQKPGLSSENQFPAHYSWNFMNCADRFQGVSFFQTWEMIRQQGHMTENLYGPDTLMSYLGWPSGYERYYQGMFHRLSAVKAIRINSLEGVNTLRNYLFDRFQEGVPGGMAAMTICSNGLYQLPFLPEGTPEGGKPVVLSWPPDPLHGLVIVGYNDSIRYDLNGDGLYTTDIDINNDQKVDIRDREIGGFRFANSYGTWWQDQGFAWVLYRAMGSDFESGGVWNNCVYVVDADKDYQPKLTMRATIRHTSRGMIRILAGICADTAQQFPKHILSFPIFNFQGGNHPMQGIDTLPGADTLEFGLDMTPLLQYIEPGKPARFFMGVEERDPAGTAAGVVRNLSFISYYGTGDNFRGPLQETAIRNNSTTFLSATGTVFFDPPRIISAALPSFKPGAPYEAQLVAAGGRTPYQWSLAILPGKSAETGGFSMTGGQKLMHQGEFRTYTQVALPFPFPFCGKVYDTLYVNRYGFITFEPLALPAPYTTDEEGMLRRVAAICPAFSTRYVKDGPAGNGQWFSATPDSVVIRWNCDVEKSEASSDNNFQVVLFPDGSIRFLYGEIRNQGYLLPVVTGLSAGDNLNHDLAVIPDFDAVSGTGMFYRPQHLPQGMSISDDGMLTVSDADTNRISLISIRVTDADGLSHTRSFSFSSGIQMTWRIGQGEGRSLEYGKPTGMTLEVINTSFQTLNNVRFSLVSGQKGLIISDSSEVATLIPAGQKVILEEAFQMKLIEHLTDGQHVDMQIRVLAASRTWIHDFFIPVSAMKLDFEKPEVDDGVNGILERGEVADLLFRVYNSGTLRGEGVRFALSTEDTLVSIISEPHFDVAHFNPSSGILFSVRIQADRHTPWGHTASFLLTTTTLGDAVSVLPFDLQIGNKPVAVINLTTGSPSPEAMMTVLDSLAVPYDLLTEIPEEPVYTALFIILGTGNQTAHHLTTEEGVHLAAFLERGGRIYMEGYSTWYYQDDTPVHPLFRYTAEKIPVYTYPFVYGVPGTFTDGMQFLNTATVNYAIFALYPRGGSTVIMTNGNEETQNMQIAFDGDGYKTIASLPEFGCLDDSTGISTRHALMSEYLGFFDINVTGPWVYFHADRKTICQGAAVEFHDDSYDQIMTREWHFPGGTPEYSALPGPQVTYVEPGNYDVTLTVHDGVNTRTLTKHQYILAYNCVNSPEVTKVPELKVYPNPVTGRCFVSFSATPSGQMTIRLLDHMGRQYLNERIAGEINPYTIEMDLFPSGIYLLVVTGENWKSTVKVIKN